MEIGQASTERFCHHDELLELLREIMDATVTICISGSRHAVATVRGRLTGMLELDGDPDGSACIQVGSAALIIGPESLEFAVCRWGGAGSHGRTIRIELHFYGGPIVEIAPDASSSTETNGCG